MLTITLTSFTYFVVVVFKQEIFQKKDIHRLGNLDLVELHAAVQEIGEQVANIGRYSLPHRSQTTP